MSLLTFPSDADRPVVLRRARFWQGHPTLSEDELFLLLAYRRADETCRQFFESLARCALGESDAAQPKAEEPIASYERQVQKAAEEIRIRCQPTADTLLDGILTAPQLARLRTIGPAQTLGDAAQRTEDELWKLPYVGHGIILKLMPWLRAAGLTFRTEGDHAGHQVGA